MSRHANYPSQSSKEIFQLKPDLGVSHIQFDPINLADWEPIASILLCNLISDDWKWIKVEVNFTSLQLRFILSFNHVCLVDHQVGPAHNVLFSAQNQKPDDIFTTNTRNADLNCSYTIIGWFHLKLSLLYFLLESIQTAPLHWF